MKKLIVVLCFTCALAIAAQAGEKKKPTLTEDQKAARKELVAKYDTNKDGKLDKEEMSKISAEEREKAGYGKPAGKHKKAQ